MPSTDTRELARDILNEFCRAEAVYRNTAGDGDSGERLDAAEARVLDTLAAGLSALRSPAERGEGETMLFNRVLYQLPPAEPVRACPVCGGRQ